jgi:hypothetical protein
MFAPLAARDIFVSPFFTRFNKKIDISGLNWHNKFPIRWKVKICFYSFLLNPSTQNKKSFDRKFNPVTAQAIRVQHFSPLLQRNSFFRLNQ